MSELKQTTNAGTIDDPIPQELVWKDAQGKFYKVAGTGGGSSSLDPRVGDLADLNTNDKSNVVAAINEVNLKQATGGAVDATDINKGVTKLSDAIDSDLAAADGVTAATPLAVKTVNSKIGDLNQLTTTAKNNLVAALNEVKANGGSGNVNYVTTPAVTAPTEGSTKVSTMLTVVGTQYENIFENDLRKHRVFEIAKSASFDSDVITLTANADSATVDSQLDGNTNYFVRIKDVSQKERESNWSPVVSFTTGDAVHANTPTITLKGYNNSESDIGSGLTIEGSTFALSVGDQSDTHASTSWVITTNSRTPVWQSLNDQTNKTSIIVPRGTLQKGTAYTVTVTYHATKFADSAPAVKQFTTSTDFGTVQAPVISIIGTSDEILETPTISGGVFSNTREPDTHAATEIKILLSENLSPIWEQTFNNATTSIEVPKGKLVTSTQYKVQLRYKGTNFGWSNWSELSFTTADSFIRYNYIGVPGTSTFGVGLAEEKDYKIVNLTPAEHCLERNNFQYGLYVRGKFTGAEDAVAMKWIPKFYIKQLQKNEGTVNLNDAELEALLPYVEVSKEQMKEAQRRSPHNALVVAPAEKFTNEADANAHGFYLMRGFIDGGKEHNGFFIANTVSVLAINSNKASYVHGAISNVNEWTDSKTTSDMIRCDTKVSNPLSKTIFSNTPTSSNAKENFIRPLTNTQYQCCSVFAWAILSVLSLIQGQYATSTADCAWYDVNLQKNFPKGINGEGYRDVDDYSVAIATPITSNKSTRFVPNNVYPKTTHNGSINGITNVNGWGWQYCIGCYGGGAKVLKKQKSIYDIGIYRVELVNDDYWETKTKPKYSLRWGSTKSVFPELNGDNNVFFGVYPFSDDALTAEFGRDQVQSQTSTAVQCNAGYTDTTNAGIFARNGSGWTATWNHCTIRVMAYPSSYRVTAYNPNSPSSSARKLTVNDQLEV